MNKSKVCLGAILFSVFVSLPLGVLAAGEEVYNTFNQFCAENFGAESDELYYERFGSSLSLVSSGEWSYVSQNSASIGFESNLPARSYVEYGLTSSYGSTTDPEERPFFLHLHSLRDLNPSTQYHYRIVCEDELGNIIRSQDRVLTTDPTGGVVYVPGSLAGPPYVLNSANTTYVLTEDLNVPQRAFTIAATNVVLDLNGHMVSYDNGEPCTPDGATWDQYLNSDCSSFGVLIDTGYSGSVYNGTIKQGGSHAGDYDIGYGFNPLFVHAGGVGFNVVAGVVLEWNGNHLSGLTSRAGRGEYHHNVIVDKGTIVGNRHQGRQAITAGDWGTYSIHHNLIKRCRQQGIVAPNEVYSNEIYIDSWATNSYGIFPPGDIVVHDNKIFGTGYHAVALGWGLQDYCDSLVYRDNFVHLQGVEPTTRDTEYGLSSSVVGVRLTQYTNSAQQYNNYLYEGNTIIVKIRQNTTEARGVQLCSDDNVVNCIFRNNTVKTEVQDQITVGPVACIVAHGTENEWDRALPIHYDNNTFISNRMHIRFGDSYQSGSRHEFRNCTFEKLGSRSDFRSIQMGYWSYDTYDNLLIDNILVGGASLDNPLFPDSPPGGLRDYSTGHSLYIVAQTSDNSPVANSLIEVQDNLGTTYSGISNSEGYVRLELLETTWRAEPGVSQPTVYPRSDHALFTSGYLPVELSPEVMAISDNPQNPVQVVFTVSGEGPSPGPPVNVMWQ